MSIFSVAEQDPLGPLSSALAPLWSTQVIVSDVHFLSCLTKVNMYLSHQIEDVNDLMTLNPAGLLEPKDPTSPSANQRIVLKLITYPVTLFPHGAFWDALQSFHRGSGVNEPD